MNHSFLARRELYESAEFFYANYGSFEDLSFFKVCRNNLHHFHGLVHHFRIRATDGYFSVVRNIDFYTGTGNDFIDGFASLAYHVSDLFRINLDGNNLRRIRSTSFLGSAMAGVMISFRMYSLASFVLLIASSTIGLVRP